MQNGLNQKTLKVTSILGGHPEQLAYALAKFSRSGAGRGKEFTDWLTSIPSGSWEKFFDDTFHKYGHASPADLAHVPMSLENVSIVAAIRLLHHPLLDCQERSTRYMNFENASFHVPIELQAHGLESVLDRYMSHCENLFSLYNELHDAFVSLLSEKWKESKDKVGEDYFKATIKARAFDLARYALPASTLTGVGFMASARTIRSLMVMQMLNQPLQELKFIADETKRELLEGPAFDLRVRQVNNLRNQIIDDDYNHVFGVPSDHKQSFKKAVDSLADKLIEQYQANSAALPSLLRHLDTSDFPEMAEQAILHFFLDRDEHDLPMSSLEKPDVILPQRSSLLDEICATLIFPLADGSRYSDVLRYVQSRSEKDKEVLIGQIQELRGNKDPVHEGFGSGSEFCFDIVTDNGGFRDLHRHRKNPQFLQDCTYHFGYAKPAEFSEISKELQIRWADACAEATMIAMILAEKGLRSVGQYAMPLAAKRPWLVKPDAAQLLYITELRTKSSGHFSYRKVAWEMFQAATERHPWIAQGAKVTPFEHFNPFER